MEPTYIDFGGMSLPATSLTIQRVRDLVEPVASGRLDFVRLIDCRRRTGADGGVIETVVLDVDVERPQVTVHDIRRVERVAVCCKHDDATVPEVLSLRADFPLVPHLNLGLEEFPRSLCLYDQPWEEVKTRWTAAAFVERIRRWLADTATGTLHRGDQALEPLLFGSGYNLVIPADAVKAGNESMEKLDLMLVPSGEHKGTFVAEPADGPPRRKDQRRFIASMFVAGTKTHGIIRRAPRSLADLCDFVRSEDFDLLRELRGRLPKWKDDGCLDASLIVIVAFPLRRAHGLEPEITDMWAFATTTSVFEVGKQLGVWDKFNGQVGILMATGTEPAGEDIHIDVLRPHFAFSRTAAALASNSQVDTRNIVAVGAGALGSQVTMNLVRGGFGRWTVIDDDDLMPHNLARHALPPWCVGMSKARALASLIDAYYEEDKPTAAITANILRAGDQKPAVNDALTGADLIVDFAASVPAARYLARAPDVAGRRLSLFLNPTGSDLVLLREGADRAVTLDCLELQYYRAVLSDDRLTGHLTTNETKHRYARSCRDVSFSLPTHQVSLLSAIGAHAIRESAAAEGPAINVWRLEAATCEVRSVAITISPVFRAVMGEWSLVIDDALMQRLSDLRTGHLPNETGGVLVGTYDLPSKTVYVVDTVPSPPDSEEWPTLYIRGSEGLKERMAEISAVTAGQLEYCGEWHSHPDGCSCNPSADDLKVFSWITDRMSAAGLPALMAIAGQGRASRWFLGEMADGGGWSG